MIGFTFGLANNVYHQTFHIYSLNFSDNPYIHTKCPAYFNLHVEPPMSTNLKQLHELKPLHS